MARPAATRRVAPTRVRWLPTISVILTGGPYTAIRRAVDADHQAHPWFRQHLTASPTRVDAPERSKATGEVRADAPSEQIARKLVALSDGPRLLRLRVWL